MSHIWWRHRRISNGMHREESITTPKQYPVPSNGSLICTRYDCPDRSKKYAFEPACLYGTDDGYVTDDEGNTLPVLFPATCDWRFQCDQCLRGFARPWQSSRNRSIAGMKKCAYYSEPDQLLLAMMERRVWEIQGGAKPASATPASTTRSRQHTRQCWPNPWPRSRPGPC